MTPRETAASYDKIASHWNSDKFDRENGIGPHRRAIQFIPQKGSAIDIGCGASGRIIDLLLAEGFSVEGLDLSSTMLRFAKERHPEVRFHHVDFCEWHPSKTYDFVSAWDSVWHIPLSEQHTALKKLCGLLNPNGILIFSTGGLDHPGHITNPCFGEPLYHAGWSIKELPRALEEHHCTCLHLEFDQFPEKHVYVIARKDAAP
ncbi:MAG: class I SAM-dependent DNA methyltransferase [Chthoniobacterales bacterium]